MCCSLDATESKGRGSVLPEREEQWPENCLCDPLNQFRTTSLSRFLSSSFPNMIASQETDDDSIAHQETVIHDEDEIKKSPAAKLSTLFKQLVFRQKSSTTDPRTWPRSKKIPIVIIVALAGAT